METITPPGGRGEAVLDFMSSRKLALWLLLLLALFSVFGTFLPADESGSYALYSSPPFVIGMVLLSLNIAVCSWRRFRRRLRTTSPRGRRKAAAWADLLLHVSLVVALGGGWGKSLWGFIGTQYLFVDVETSRVHDWQVGREVPLGFTLVMREMREDFYPLQLRLGVRNAGTGEKVTLMEVREGKEAFLKRGDLKVAVAGYDPAAGVVSLDVETGGGRKRIGFGTAGGAEEPILAGPYALHLVAYRRDLKKVWGRIAVIDDGREVKEQWLAVNSRIAYRGTSVFQTGWGRDEFMNPYIGIQVSRDPAAPVFWFGGSMLCLLMPLLLYLRHGGRAPAGDREGGTE